MVIKKMLLSIFCLNCQDSLFDFGRETFEECIHVNFWKRANLS